MMIKYNYIQIIMLQMVQSDLLSALLLLVLIKVSLLPVVALSIGAGSSPYWAAKTWLRLRGEMKPKMIFFFSGLWLLGGPTLLPGLLPLQPALLQLWKHRGYNNPAQCSPVGLTSAPCWPGETWQHRSKLLHHSSLQFNINRLSASFQPVL